MYHEKGKIIYLLSKIYPPTGDTQRRFATAPESANGSGGINMASGI
ncbi:MAG: hypothetical protein LBL58_04715 [Tannerellaceae bacterium]|nr:hypothetical protein [Tannerellaceae bacterium]